MPEETISVPIAPNARIDGGPFVNFRGHGGSDGVLRNDRDRPADIEEIEDAIVNEMNSAEPINLDTGDVGTVGGNPVIVGTIELPCVEGYEVTIHDFNAPTFPLGSVSSDPDVGRGEVTPTIVERKIRRYGATIEG